MDNISIPTIPDVSVEDLPDTIRRWHHRAITSDVDRVLAYVTTGTLISRLKSITDGDGVPFYTACEDAGISKSMAYTYMSWSDHRDEVLEVLRERVRSGSEINARLKSIRYFLGLESSLPDWIEKAGDPVITRRYRDAERQIEAIREDTRSQVKSIIKNVQERSKTEVQDLKKTQRDLKALAKSRVTGKPIPERLKTILD